MRFYHSQAAALEKMVAGEGRNVEHVALADDDTDALALRASLAAGGASGADAVLSKRRRTRAG